MSPILTAFATSPDRGQGLARDMRVRWALEELGVPYDVQLLSFTEMKQPAHLARGGEHHSPVPEGNTGDGIRMAQAAGADLSTLDAFYGHVLSRDAMHNERVWPYPQLDELAAAGVLVKQCGQHFGFRLIDCQ